MRTIPLMMIALSMMGCAAGQSEQVDEARQAEIDTGFLNQRKMRMMFDDSQSTPFATMDIVSRTIGAFEPGNEYWYVNLDSVSMLGQHGLTITIIDSSSEEEPEAPGYTHEQQFTLDEFPSGGWGSSWTSDPVSGGTLHGDGYGTYVRLFTSSGAVSRIVWYQVIESNRSPSYLTPGGSFSVTSSVSVPSGYLGYDIDQTP